MAAAVVKDCHDELRMMRAYENLTEELLSPMFPPSPRQAPKKIDATIGMSYLIGGSTDHRHGLLGWPHSSSESPLLAAHERSLFGGGQGNAPWGGGILAGRIGHVRQERHDLFNFVQ